MPRRRNDDLNETATAPAADASGDRKSRLDEALRRRIVSMELAPSAVVDEIKLCEEFGLSRPPVRELMRQLAAEGYIELEPNRPARVTPMSFQSLRNFFLAAPLVYVATAQLAARLATAEDVQQLTAIQQNFRHAFETGDTEARVLHNDAFHAEIGRVARNAYLMPSLRRLLIDHARLAKVFYRTASPEDMQRDLAAAVDQHDEIIQAIAQHDADAVGEVMRAHMDLSRRRMAEYVMPDGLDGAIRF